MANGSERHEVAINQRLEMKRGISLLLCWYECFAVMRDSSVGQNIESGIAGSRSKCIDFNISLEVMAMLTGEALNRNGIYFA